MTPSGLSEVHVMLGRLGVNQDFFWFAVLLLWSAALIAWPRAPRRDTAWCWLPWAAAAGGISALVEFLIFDPPLNLFYERLVPGTTADYVPAAIDPNVFGDIALAALQAAVLGGWGWQLLSGRPRAWRWLLLVLVIGLSVTQAMEPQMGGWLLTLALPAAAVLLMRRLPPHSLRARIALLAASLLPLASTVGPLAWAAHAAQRNGPPTIAGVFFACTELVVAALALTGLLAGRGPEERARFWRAVRPFAAGAVIWLVGGLVFAVITGKGESLEVETNRLRTAAARAATLDRHFVTCLARLPDASATEQAATRHAAELVLLEMVNSTPFLTEARILFIRDGWSEIFASAPKSTPAPDRQRRLSADEQRQFARGEPYNAYSPIPEAGQPYYCRAPIALGNHAPVAWLEFVREEFYSSIDRKWRTAPLLVTALGLIIGTFVVLQRSSARERLQAEHAAVLAAESNRVKTAFLAKVSHELRTPLQSILGYCEQLQIDGDPANRAPRLAALRQHGELMLRLVNDLLDLSTIESGAFRFVDRPVQLGELVVQTVDSLRHRATAKGLELSCAVDPELPAWVATDPERWRQIVLNLAGNAVKFTARGRVAVALRVVERDARTVSVELEVTDTGPGIPVADQPRLFQSFARLELTAEHEGAGLGLALVAALCRAAGGEIGVTSDGRAGACFRARLPVRITAAPAAPDGGPAVVLEGMRVLVVDDNRLVRELFADHLTSCGAQCDTAADGETAISAVASGGYDAVVVDLALPGMDGIEVARRLRRDNTAVRIVGASAHAADADRARAIEAGMDAFVVKPVRLADLARAVREPAVPGGPATAPATRARMAQLFRAEAPERIEALVAARAARDWGQARAQAHWLCNSAIALGDDDLGRLAASLETAAETRDEPAFDGHWQAAQSRLQANLAAA